MTIAVLTILGVYLAIGLAFAVPFAWVGAGAIDPAASGAGWGFKILIVPGSAILWPLLLARWIRGTRPTECTAHRRAAVEGDR